MREEESTTQSCTVLRCFQKQRWISFHNARVYFTLSVSEDVAQGLEEERGGEQEEGEQHLGRGEGAASTQTSTLLLPILSSLHLTVVI